MRLNAETLENKASGATDHAPYLVLIGGERSAPGPLSAGKADRPLRLGMKRGPRDALFIGPSRAEPCESLRMSRGTCVARSSCGGLILTSPKKNPLGETRGGLGVRPWR